MRYEYSEEYRVDKSLTFAGKWTEDEAKAFYDEKYEQIKAEVEALAQAEVNRLMTLRDELNS